MTIIRNVKNLLILNLCNFANSYKCFAMASNDLSLHIKCRNNKYPFSNVERAIVPDDKIRWNVGYDEYDPPEYCSYILRNKPWADLDSHDPQFNPKWNEIDGNINRISYLGNYTIVNNRPLNPIGRTGLSGRGILGKWGPNHAADPIVTRWKRESDGSKACNECTKLPILQFCAIQRQHCNEWAIPGGMVDPGEKVSQTLMREFLEEAFNSLEENMEEEVEVMIRDFFKNGDEIYRGYVDDPRNTDNAWMETVAVNFHDDDGTIVAKFNLKAGDDAMNVKWTDVDHHLNLYASHSSFIERVAHIRNAHW